MRLAYKQLLKEIVKNKIFVNLMLLSAVLTSSVYYFVHFSIDGNLYRLDLLSTLSDSQTQYRIALVSNTILARNVLLALTSLTGFVFALFFYRFFRANRKPLGCLKALGIKDAALGGFFIAFAAILSLLGALIGLGAGYFASDILIAASKQSYLVTGLVKELHVGSALIGLFFPAAVFCLSTILSYGLIRGKETGLLIAGTGNTARHPATLRFADKLAGFAPAKSRLYIRLALRKPVAVLLIVMSVTTFSIMFILAYSLTLSSGRVVESQTRGHNYMFETHFDIAQPAAAPDSITLPYLDASGLVEGRNMSVQRTVAGLGEDNALFTLLDTSGNAVALPQKGEAVVGADLRELYGLEQGDSITVSVGEEKRELKISGIAFNAKANWIYISKDELSELLSLPEDSYTGFLSMDNHFKGGTVITQEQKQDTLRRGSVSSQSSGLINQAIGCIVGCILLYLALLLNFQDSTRDILILHMMGHRPKSIRKTLIDIYRPVLWLSFFLTLLPAVQIVKSILQSLSIQTGDYMPFQTNLIVIAGVFVLQNVVYMLVQATFNLGIAKIIRKDTIASYMD